MDEQPTPADAAHNPQRDPWTPPPLAPAQRRRHRRRALRTAGRLALLTATILVAVMLFNATDGFGTRATPPPTASSTGSGPTTSADAARRSAEVFFTAWQQNDLTRAAAVTDDPTSARTTLTEYRTALHLRSLKYSIQRITAQGTVLYSITAAVELPVPNSDTLKATWTYNDYLTTYPIDGVWLIKWHQSVVAPNLIGAETLTLLPVPPRPGPAHATDTAGRALSTSSDPALHAIDAALGARAPHGKPTPGLEVALTVPGQTSLPGTADVILAPTTGAVATTIDPKTQAAAETAVHLSPGSSMAVIEPSTGRILALADNDGADAPALTARTEPGPAGEILSFAALDGQGLTTSSNQPVTCPAQLTVDGETLTNQGGASEPAATALSTDFTASCGNAFAQWYDRIGAASLAQTATTYFGLNQPWDIGLGTSATYYTMPTHATGAELARELTGEGATETCPLALASIAATLETGTFTQPTVIPGQPRHAAVPLPAETKQNLWQLMNTTTAPAGTAVHSLAGTIHSTLYAQTGTAQPTATGGTDNWAVAFDPTLDLAVATLVQGTTPDATAAQETATLFKALQ